MKFPFLRRALAALVGITAVATVHATPLDDLRRQVEAGQYEAAYQASRANPDWLGNPHFDFLLGLSAINSGHVAEGLLALERHLATVPANDRARLELARGYFLLGEYGRARQEFEFVLKHNPPAEVQDNIRRYLTSMQTRDIAAQRATSRFYVEASVGHDSNVNGGTYNNEIRLITSTIPLNDPQARAVGDNYGQLTVGGQWIKRVSPQLAVFAGGDVDVRHNEKQEAYDLNTYGAFVGFSYLKGAGLYRVSLADNRMDVHNNPYRGMYSMTGEAQYTLAPGTSLTGFAQYGETNYWGDNRVRDSKLTTLGATLTQGLSSLPWGTFVGLRLSTTEENNLRMRDDLSRHILTARLFVGASPLERLGVTAGLLWQEQDFEKTDLAFGSTRHDLLKGADLGMNYAFNRNWSTRLEWQYSDNQSNQSLYDFRRRAWAMKARYEF